MDSVGKKPVYKRWWFWVVAFFAFTTFIGLLNPSQAPQTDSAPQATTETPKTNTEVVAASQPPTATPTEQAPAIAAAEAPTASSPSTLDQLWLAVDTSLKTRKGIDIHYFPDEDGSVILYHQDDDFWDDNTLVRDAYADLVYFGQEAFKIDGIPEVEVIVTTKFTDQYGKTEYADAVRISMKKEEFQKYDWSTLKFMPIYQQMKNSSTEYYIQPGVAANLNPEKLYLN